MAPGGRAVPAEALDLLVDAFAAYRLTRLATADVISEPFRRSMVGRALGWGPEELAAASPTAQEAVDALDHPPKAARLITCRWCAGMWIAGGVVAARQVVPGAWAPVARALAVSSVAVLISRLEDG
ncbi:MAG: hypothetical protein JWM47_2553 [Acidimicrobiales bacterium]|nr:hypothetical protein [Acidimicrobiales bacterium]